MDWNIFVGMFLSDIDLLGHCQMGYLSGGKMLNGLFGIYPGGKLSGEKKLGEKDMGWEFIRWENVGGKIILR